MSNILTISKVNMSINHRLILNNVSLNLKQGELGALIGPSGSGKSTLLKVIAGLENINSGNIFLNGKDITNLSADKRKIGLVFQDYALFSHLTARENVLIGLTKNQIDYDFFNKLLALLKLEDLLERYPHQISGGQQQRVAIFRSLIRKPELILLDEPFSGLDAHLKEAMASEFRTLFKELNINAILVTHDQKEAFNFSDSIGILFNGKLEQWDSPFNLYHSPNNKNIANFIGDTKFIHAKVCNQQLSTILGNFISSSKLVDGDAELMIRPDDVIPLESNKLDTCTPGEKMILTGNIIEVNFLGAHYLYTIELENKEVIKAISPSHQRHDLNSNVKFYIEMDKVIAF